MIRFRITVLVLGIACILAPSASAQTDTSVNVLGIARPGMAEVRVSGGKMYRPGLSLDVYTSPSQRSTERRPAVIFVHGGLVAGAQGVPPTRWAIYQSWGRLAAVSGWVGVTFNHRLTTDDNVVLAESDVRAAVRYVRENAESLGVDRDRLCVAFYSAGGEVAAAALHEPEPYVRCVVLFYPFLDLEHQRTKTAFRDAYPSAHVDSLIARYSPATLIAATPRRVPPIYLAMAGQDAIPHLNESIERFMRVALEQRIRIDFALHPSGQHGFDRANQDERTREILDDVLRFIGRHLSDEAAGR